MTHFRVVGDIHGHYQMYGAVVQDVPCSFQVGDMGLDYSHFPVLDASRHVFIGGNHDDYTLKVRPDISINDPSILQPGSNLTVVRPTEDFYIPEQEKYAIYLNKYIPNIEEPTVFEYASFPANCLGNFGTWKIPKTNVEVFYVRGAWSIDGFSRRKNDWGWHVREQLSPEECAAALKLYEEKKPSFVITHAAPVSVMGNLRLFLSEGRAISTATSHLLQFMFEAHKPKLWIFGHYHQHWLDDIDGTRFICLGGFPTYEYGWTVDFDHNLSLLGFDMHELGPLTPPTTF